jgi:outer membrane biosynthesis protein TonB
LLISVTAPIRRQHYSRELKQQVLDAAATEGFKQACADYGVNLNSAKHFKHQLAQHVPIGYHNVPGAGRPRLLDPVVEDVLDHLIRSQREKFELVLSSDVKTQAKQLFEEFGEDGRFLASSGWLHDFLTRHHFSTHSTKSLIHSAADPTSDGLMSDAARVRRFIHQVRFVVDQRKFDNSRKANCDETHLAYESRPLYCVADKGGKGPVKIASEGKEKAGCTVLLCTAADGYRFCPLILFKGMDEMPVVHDPTKSLVHFVPKGFMNQDIYSWWIEQEVAKHFPDGCLLVHDAFGGHQTDKVQLTAHKHHISLVTIPEGLTAKVQPMDVSINGPFKRSIAVHCAHFHALRQQRNQTEPLSAELWRNAVVGWVEASFSALDPAVIRKSFLVTGIANAVDGSEDSQIDIRIDGISVRPDPFRPGSDKEAEKEVELPSDEKVLVALKEYSKKRKAKKEEKERKKKATKANEEKEEEEDDEDQKEEKGKKQKKARAKRKPSKKTTTRSSRKRAVFRTSIDDAADALSAEAESESKGEPTESANVSQKKKTRRKTASRINNDDEDDYLSDSDAANSTSSSSSNSSTSASQSSNQRIHNLRGTQCPFFPDGCECADFFDKAHLEVHIALAHTEE